MITRLRARNFKSWQDTGVIRLAPITGLFGANSSGKTAILQLLLMMKQTIESADRARVLHLGDDRSYVDLGTFWDVIFGHELPARLTFELGWTLRRTLRIPDPEAGPSRTLFSSDSLTFSFDVQGDESGMSVEQFVYGLAADRGYQFGMQRRNGSNGDRSNQYDILSEGYKPKRMPGRPWPLPAPVKSYGFPDQVSGYYQNMGFVSFLTLALEEVFARLFYLGPLREYPHRSYLWAGGQPKDVGQRGELAVPALLAARERGMRLSRGRGRTRQHIDERIAEWLRDLGLIHSFELQAIAPNRKEYEVKVRRTASSPTVLITDVGFGVSQILPVLTLCYYAPEGATLILEQPEIHLHPSVQAGLADVFVDAAKTRNIQIILESHSEHLLHRLQRRIAEEELPASDTALYFVNTDGGASAIQQLDVDLFGNITNWPQNFFGDEMADLVAMTRAAMRRRATLGGEQP